MYRFLLRPRWLVLHAVVLVLVPTFLCLARWQFDKHQMRRVDNALIQRNIAVPAVPLQLITQPDNAISREDTWRQVSATGRYDPDHQILVRNRTVAGKPGFLVLTPLVTDTGVAVVVNRGWIPPGPNALTPIAAPAPPTAEVQITGRIRPSEPQSDAGPRDDSDLPKGQVARIDIPRIATRLHYFLYGGYLELTDQQPEFRSGSPEESKAALVAMPPPGISAGPYLSYAGQWCLFAIATLAGWLVLVVRKVHSDNL